jgi:hypothetical protein
MARRLKVATANRLDGPASQLKSGVRLASDPTDKKNAKLRIRSELGEVKDNPVLPSIEPAALWHILLCSACVALWHSQRIA